MIWSIALGFVIGSIPSADILGRLAGLDIRRMGSGNPGTANALRVGGTRLAAWVLAFDLAKGVAAVLAGAAIGGGRAAIAAAVAAVAGQIHNPWFGFRGGKGLGVLAGSALLLWPPGALIAAAVAAPVARLLGATPAALTALAVILVGAIGWASADMTTWWGTDPDDGLVWYAIGAVALTLPKFASQLRRKASR